MPWFLHPGIVTLLGLFPLAALALGAEALRDAATLTDHPVEDGHLDVLAIRDPLETHVLQLDAVLRGEGLCGREDPRGELVAPDLDTFDVL